MDMSSSPNQGGKDAKAMMLGLGLDSDGHKRVTRGDNFALVGGTEETHDGMVEKAVKINEKLARKGKAWCFAGRIRRYCSIRGQVTPTPRDN